MKFIILSLSLISLSSYAAPRKNNRRIPKPRVTPVTDKKSEPSPKKTQFPLGDGVEKWGVELRVPDDELSLRLGARFQSLTTVAKDEQDFQARRVRFQLEAKLPHDITYYMDVRNDQANEDDKGERNFQVGDAYVQVPLDTDGPVVSVLRLFRAKVDVSRTQTVSSSSLLFVNRPKVADEAAQFVSQARRASNAQLIGDFWQRIYYQVVIGDGVQSERFLDAKSKKVTRIDGQNFMVGGKLRFSPFKGWEDLKVTETYFGKGQHFSFGAGYFNTSKIQTVTGSAENTVSRNLTNYEASFHYKEWSLFSEYFQFDGVVEDHSAANFNKGTSDGWYVQGEKLFTEFYYLAPFARYESWDRFRDSGDYLSTNQLYGINWYANGNRFKLSLAYEHVENEEDTGLSGQADLYHLATAWHF